MSTFFRKSSPSSLISTSIGDAKKYEAAIVVGEVVVELSVADPVLSGNRRPQGPSRRSFGERLARDQRLVFILQTAMCPGK